MSATLPAAFAAYEDLVDHWALGTENERRNRRMTSTQAQLQAFYDRTQPALDDWVRHLNGFDLDHLPEPERNLLNLALAVVEVSPAIELFDNPWPKDVYPWDKFDVAY